MSYPESPPASFSPDNPVPPSKAHAAQLPLQSFSLPTFPSEAFSSGLQSLILTADIALDEYTSLLNAPFSVPYLPTSITALTLELFSLGFPPGFLSKLGWRLPALKTLTVYSGLLSGTTSESRKDAVAFLQAQKDLKELHLLDVFGPKGFFSELSGALTDDVKFLEISFTYRHSDTAFMNTLPRGEELKGFVKKGLFGLTMRISETEVEEEMDEEDLDGREEGSASAQQKDGGDVVKRVVELGGGLKVLDLTMFELEGSEVKKIVESCRDLKVLGLGVSMEEGWEEVFEALVGGEGEGNGKAKEEGGEVEVLELIGVPGKELMEKIKMDGEPRLNDYFLGQATQKWNKLQRVKVSVLRTELEQWTREGEVWRREDYE